MATMLFYSNNDSPETFTLETYVSAISVADTLLSRNRILTAKIINSRNAKDAIYTAYRKVKVIEGTTGNIIFIGRVVVPTPSYDSALGQILTITCSDYMQELFDRKVNKDYTYLGAVKRSALIAQLLTDYTYSGSIGINLGTNIANSGSSQTVTKNYLNYNKNVVQVIEELAQEDAWDDTPSGYGYDYYIDDGTVTSLTLRPNGAGAQSDLTPSPAVSNYLNVDEVVTDDMTTTVASNSTSYVTDTYALQNHTSEIGAINSVQVFAICKQTSTPTQPTMQINLRVGSTNYTGNARTLTSSFASYSNIWIINPSTKASWTWSDIDSLQAGVSLKTDVSSNIAYCTQVYIVVSYTSSVPNFNYFKRGSRPAGGPALTVELGATESLTKRSMMHDYSFAIQPNEVYTRVTSYGQANDGTTQTYTATNATLEATLGLVKEAVDYNWGSDLAPAALLTYVTNRAKALLSYQSGIITRGEFGIYRYPYISSTPVLTRVGDVITCVIAPQSINASFIVLTVTYDEPAGIARLGVVSSNYGRNQSPLDLTTLIQGLSSGQNISVASARISDLIVNDAKITSLSASKITTGSLQVGIYAGTGSISTSATTSYLTLTSSGIDSYHTGTQRMHLGADGSGWLGASNAIYWTNTGALTVKGSLVATGIIADNITTGTLDCSVVTIKSASSGSRIQIDGDYISGYNSSNTQQFYIRATDGKALAGGGAVILDSTGINIDGRLLFFGTYGASSALMGVYLGHLTLATATGSGVDITISSDSSISFFPTDHNIFIDGNIYPMTTTAYSLGGSSFIFSQAYINAVHLGHYDPATDYDAATKRYVDTHSSVVNWGAVPASIIPASSSYDLGSTSYYWSKLYIGQSLNYISGSTGDMDFRVNNGSGGSNLAMWITDGASPIVTSNRTTVYTRLMIPVGSNMYG